MAQLGGRSFEEMRVIVLEFLDTDIFHLSVVKAALADPYTLQGSRRCS